MDRPYELRQYIAEQQQRAGEANNADFKATYQSEIDRITERCDTRYKQGRELIESLDQADLNRCRKLYAHRVGNSYRMDSLTEERVNGIWVLVPAYVTLIEELGKLKEMLGFPIAGTTVRVLNPGGSLRPLSAIINDVIRIAIRKHEGNMTIAAKKLCIGRSTLYRKVQKL